MCTVPLLNRVCRESYSEPHAVYQTLKQRGMDLITVTDHDSIDAAECLRRESGFFLSEEVSAVAPTGSRLHVGVYDIEEHHHTEIQRRREDLMSLIAYLGEQQLFFTINHVYSSLTGPRTEADFELFTKYFPGIEVLNGQMSALSNRRAAELSAAHRKVGAGGSDAHTLASLGQTYTQVSSARTKREFFQGLRAGQASIHGGSGSYWKLTLAVSTLALEMMREKPWTLLLSPLLPAVPLVTLANCIRETAFVYRWARPTSLVGAQSAVCEAGS
jgi:predicted metal-dependent phosphoesterase TrpH